MYRGAGRVRLHMGVGGARLCAVGSRARLCVGVQV